ncbi:MAG: ADP-heptose--LPS heptosyltransferase [Legionellaceae bacterium]|nr:ADP-heptose--LPS heptosyltransferase [Legionellaceae bacterium]|tara:strand:- start:4565 stop:5587 length:1023 start_codon:yes stop_codon:yes gene_type:complete
MINSLCIVRLSALGDVLMLVPLIRTLQAYNPAMHISWVISEPAYALVENLENIEFLVIKKPQSPKDYWHFYRLMHQRSYDALLATQASLRANLLYPFIRAARKIGYDTLRAKDGHAWFIQEAITPGDDHTVEGFLKFASQLGIKQSVISWNLPLDEAALSWASQWCNTTKKILIVNPAASKPERSWLAKRYIEVIEYAQSILNMHVILTGGPGKHDRQLADEILQKVFCVDMVGKTKLKQLLALISKADLVLCPDTGPSHMATSVGTPVIALHAVTSPYVSGPYLCREFAIDYYPAAVQKILNKTLEQNIWGTHVHGTDAMQLITVKDVIKMLDKVILNN